MRAISFFALVPAAHAAESPTLPPVIVTGTQLPASEASVPRPVIAIPESEIRDRAPASLPDVLRNTPSLYVDQVGAPGGFSSLYLRGADPNHTVILIDGVKVSDTTNTRGGGIDLSFIDPRTISRIEIVPGASSAIYGPDAMAGVVNIITRQPKDTGLLMSAGAGGHGYASAFATGSIVRGNVASQAAAASTQDGHSSDAAFFRSRTGSLRFTAGEGERRVTAWVRAQHYDGAAFPDDSGGPLYAVRRELERRETDGVVGALALQTPTAWGSMRLYSNVFSQDADVQSPGVAPGVRDPVGIPRSVSGSQYQRVAIGAIATFGSGDEAPALIGMQYEKESGDVASTLFFGLFAVPANFALERHTRSVFTEGRLNIGDGLTAQLGVRADDTEAYGTRVTMQAALRYWLHETLPGVGLSYATGFKPPSFFALGHPIVGNLQLQPEQSRTVELSIASDPNPTAARPIAYRGALFHTAYENLVDFDAGPPPRLVNRSQVDIKGYEAAVTARASESLNLRAGMTGLSFALPEGTPDLRSRPRFRATASAAYSVTPQVTASLYGSWVSRIFDSSVPTGNVYLPPYPLFDASLAFGARDMQFVIAVDNVLDRHFQQFVGFPNRGRRVRVEVSFRI